MNKDLIVSAILLSSCFATSLHYKNDFIAALLKEIVLQKDYLGNETVDTIYFGGGTPSLCTK